ncbi:MAG: hypothetical protein J0M00_06695 [Burkholderiales bacterium]|nr:hypothetical protein [Burkholderiales bacterium]
MNTRHPYTSLAMAPYQPPPTAEQLDAEIRTARHNGLLHHAHALSMPVDLRVGLDRETVRDAYRFAFNLSHAYAFDSRTGLRRYAELARNELTRQLIALVQTQGAKQ